MKNIVISRNIFRELDLKRIYPLISYDELDNVLSKYAAVEDLGAGDIKMVSFAVVTYGDRILAVNKGSELVLGFGRIVSVGQEHKSQSLKGHIVDALYEESDIYLPNKAFNTEVIGLIASGDRAYDRTSLGCLFNIELLSPIVDESVGQKKLRMLNVGDVDPLRLRGWSEVIFRYFPERKYLAVN